MKHKSSSRFIVGVIATSMGLFLPLTTLSAADKPGRLSKLFHICVDALTFKPKVPTRIKARQNFAVNLPPALREHYVAGSRPIAAPLPAHLREQLKTELISKARARAYKNSQLSPTDIENFRQQRQGPQSVALQASTPGYNDPFFDVFLNPLYWWHPLNIYNSIFSNQAAEVQTEMISAGLFDPVSTDLFDAIETVRNDLTASWSEHSESFSEWTEAFESMPEEAKTDHAEATDAATIDDDNTETESLTDNDADTDDDARRSSYFNSDRDDNRDNYGRDNDDTRESYEYDSGSSDSGSSGGE